MSNGYYEAGSPDIEYFSARTDSSQEEFLAAIPLTSFYWHQKILVSKLEMFSEHSSTHSATAGAKCTSGANCQRCNTHNEYISDPNYICYSCRT